MSFELFVGIMFCHISILSAVQPGVIIGKSNSDIQMLSPYLNQTYFTASDHTKTVQWLKIMPDETLASGSSDTLIKIWNLTNGVVLRNLKGHSAGVNSLDVLNNGLLVSGSGDKSIVLWNTATGDVIRNLTNAHTASVVIVKSLNDCYFASGGIDNLAKIWDMSTMSVLTTLSGHTGGVYAIEYLPDGTVVTGALDKSAIVWNPRTGVKLVTFNPISAGIYSIRLISQDQVVAIAGQSTKIGFFRISGTMSPVNVKTITISTSVFSMTTYNLMYNNVNSTILYVGGSTSSYAFSINVTSLSNIVVLNSLAIDTSNTALYSVEKSMCPIPINVASSSTVLNQISTTETTAIATTSSGSVSSKNSASTSTTSQTTTNAPSTTNSPTTSTTSALATTIASAAAATTTSAINSAASLTTTKPSTTVTVAETTTTGDVFELIFSNNSAYEFALSSLATSQIISLLSDGYDLADCIVNCSNKGMCKFSSNKTFVCACIDNYTGRTCSAGTRPCMYSPCLNNGTCFENGTSSSSTNTTMSSSSNSVSNSSYYCDCGLYYYGKNCQNLIDWCTNATCLNGGYCTASVENKLANCTCVSGYSGTKCEIESNSLKTVKQVTSIAGLVPLFVFAGIYLLMMFFDLVTLMDTKRKLQTAKKRRRLFKPLYRA